MIPFLIDSADPLFSYFSEHLAQFGAAFVFEAPGTPVFLHFDGNRLILHENNQHISADFCAPDLLRRTRQNTGELILRAVNIKENRHIWDATAGLGKDAFILAAFGAQVRLFERNPYSAFLLLDALRRAQNDDRVADIAARMTLTVGSISDIIEAEKPEVVYLDPMFPARRKSAQVKKGMQILQHTVGADDDSATLLDCARTWAQKRIVVKRPVHGDFLASVKADYQYCGKSTRFDVYKP